MRQGFGRDNARRGHDPRANDAAAREERYRGLAADVGWRVSPSTSGEERPTFGGDLPRRLQGRGARSPRRGARSLGAPALTTDKPAYGAGPLHGTRAPLSPRTISRATSGTRSMRFVSWGTESHVTTCATPAFN